MIINIPYPSFLVGTNARLRVLVQGQPQLFGLGQIVFMSKTMYKETCFDR